MAIRDATESDAQRIAGLVGTSTDAARGIVRDRTVRVCVEDAHIAGVVSFDATSSAVQVTGLAGDPGTYGTLIDEPVRFGEREGLPIEMVVPTSDEAVIASLEAAGFDPVADGPSFGGEPTACYRRTTE